tara:strand:+ start:2180 stop:2434 length:255 start_codon:yes stop_codon:yes gene_type:complete
MRDITRTAKGTMHVPDAKRENLGMLLNNFKIPKITANYVLVGNTKIKRVGRNANFAGKIQIHYLLREPRWNASAMKDFSSMKKT